ncbi:RNA polymerase sigma factor [Actinokineospora pegani]|uniref:RNA polymerase sigma factor n=1 Tax=Actinokineospora pegani TaxID=2654637 RepID=UPI001F177CEC|nr:sigma-70 family RNA polymerase sigma factor [Actinokineospora pegani]
MISVVGTDPPWNGLRGAERHAACLLAAREGDRTALGVIVAELSPLVWHIARGVGLDRAAAEDVTQQVWLSLLRNLHSLTEPRALVGWLGITAKREAVRTHKRTVAQVELTPEAADQVVSSEPMPETELLRGERDRKLWKAFHALSQRCQELLRLTVLDGRAEYTGVAEAMKMPRGSIGPTRGRCLKNLRDRYEDGDGGT